MEPRKLSIGQGWQWIKRGYALFMKAPLLWVVLLSVCFIAVAALSAVPTIGEPLTSLLLPVILVGLMVGCRALEQGEDLELAHLLSGFQQRAAQLVTLGGIALVGQYLVLGVMGAVGGGALVSILMSGQPVEDPEIIKQAVIGAGLAIPIGMALFSIILMAMQFAPMLVFFNKATPVEAMKLSMRAFINNMAPMLVYGMTFMLLAMLASIPMMLGWLVLLPIVFTSLYACYCDIFPAEKEVVPHAENSENTTPDKTA